MTVLQRIPSAVRGPQLQFISVVRMKPKLNFVSFGKKGMKKHQLRSNKTIKSVYICITKASINS